MKVALCSDHRGYRAKECVKTMLQRGGHQVEDFGCHDPTSCDYPDWAIPASQSIAAGQSNVGIMFCGTGIGMSITANKVRGIRAALCHDELTAELARKHNDANVLCLPADLVGEELMKRIVEVWFSTAFEGGRHTRRNEKIARFERANESATPSADA